MTTTQLLGAVALAATAVLAPSGCVSSQAYNMKSAELERVRRESVARETELKALRTQVSELNSAIVQRDDRISLLKVECEGQGTKAQR